ARTTRGADGRELPSGPHPDALRDRRRGSPALPLGHSRSPTPDAPQARHVRKRHAAHRRIAQARRGPVFHHADGVYPLRRGDRVSLSLGARLPIRGHAAFRRDAGVSGDPRGRLRVPLEEEGVRLVTSRRYGVTSSGQTAEFPPAALERIDRILSRYPTKQAALLPVLWVAQETWGWISKEAGGH